MTNKTHTQNTAQAQSKRPAPSNGPSKTGEDSGKRRGNNPPAPKNRASPPKDIGGYVKQGW